MPERRIVAAACVSCGLPLVSLRALTGCRGRIEARSEMCTLFWGGWGRVARTGKGREHPGLKPNLRLSLTLDLLCERSVHSWGTFGHESKQKAVWRVGDASSVPFPELPPTVIFFSFPPRYPPGEWSGGKHTISFPSGGGPGAEAEVEVVQCQSVHGAKRRSRAAPVVQCLVCVQQT